MSITSAKGVEGQLIYSMDGKYYFRVYHKDAGKTFTDYELLHYDLTITINDDDAYFYDRDGEKSLDHSPATLGLFDKF